MPQQNKIQLFEERKMQMLGGYEHKKWNISIVDVFAVLADSPTLPNIGVRSNREGRKRVDYKL